MAKTTWDKLQLAPVMLIRGPEEVIASRAEARVRDLANKADPNVGIIDVEAATYQAGQLGVHTAPSLFGEARLIRINNLETLSESLAKDLLEYLKAPEPDVWILARHAKGQKGKKLLEAISKAGMPVVQCDPIKSARDKADLLKADARRAHRSIEPAAVEALVDALGSDLQEMCAALAQLFSDKEGKITEQDVHTFYGNRVEASGFAIADAAVAGNSGKAIELARHGFATGAAPVAMMGALALKVRNIAKVSSGARNPRGLGMAPWQADRARREARGWSQVGLAEAIAAVAAGEEEIKGASRDPEFAFERALLRVGAAHGRH